MHNAFCIGSLFISFNNANRIIRTVTLHPTAKVLGRTYSTSTHFLKVIKVIHIRTSLFVWALLSICSKGWTSVLSVPAPLSVALGWILASAAASADFFIVSESVSVFNMCVRVTE